MFVEQLRRAVKASPRVELARVAQMLWKAYAAGHVSEAEAAALSEAIEARRALPAAQKPIQRRLGSRPKTRFAGKTPSLGLLWGAAASARQPVHLS